MRIAYVCADRGVRVFGQRGSSIHVQEVIRGFLENGARVELFAVRTGGDPPPGLEVVGLHHLPKSPGSEPVIRERAALSANDDLLASLEGGGHFDLVYERHSLWSYAGMEYARDRGIPGVLEVNAPLIQEQNRYRSLVLQSEAERAVARAFGASSALVAVSDGVAEYLNRHPAARGRTHVVSNGVDPRRFRVDQTQAWSGADGLFTVGFVGTLKPWHGVQGLIEAFDELHRYDPNVRLLIVGDGPQRHELEAEAAARGLRDAALFTGAVDPLEIPAWLASMDVAVAPYPPFDDFYFSPLKLFEYMAAGRAIVAAAIGQIRQLITGGDTGLMYPPGDTAALSTALHRLKIDPGLRRRLGQAARRAAIRNHTWHAVTARILALGHLSSSQAKMSQPVS